MRRIIICLLCLFPLTMFAKTLNVDLVLQRMHAVKTSEASTDELYFYITEYYPSKLPNPMRVPTWPQNIHMNDAETVSNIPLWKGALDTDQSILLNIELVEHDMPPWNLDDPIHYVKLRVRNFNNKLQFAWQSPGEASPLKYDTIHRTNNRKRLVFKSDDANFELDLSINAN